MSFALLLPLLVASQDDFSLSEGAHVHALCWFRMVRAGGALSEELRDAGEAAWAEAAAWTGQPEGPLEAPFLVNLYAKRREYVGAVEGTVSGAAEGSVAWGHWESRQVHVKIQPVLDERKYDALGLPHGTLRQAAREVARLAVIDAGGDPDLAPRWFLEGLAGWSAQRGLESIERASNDLARCPHRSTAAAQAQELLRAGRLPQLREVLLDAPGPLTAAERMALHEVLFEHLAEDEAWRARGPRLARGWKGEALLAELDIDALEAGFFTWLEALRPPWREELGSLGFHMDGLQQLTFKGESASCWATAPPPPPPYTIRGEFYLYKDREGMGQVNVMLGRLGEDYIMFAFNTQGGAVAFRYDSAMDAAGQPPFVEIQGKTLDPPLPPRTWVPFAIHVDEDGQVSGEVGDEDLMPFDTTGRRMDGAWGIGTFAGSIGVWRDVECVPGG